MCGIAGIVGADATRDVAEAMTRALAHRGPDDLGLHADGDVFLGQTRLKIIDLVTGDQPMSNETGDVWIVFNGEIYNFQELRQELIGHGHVFRSQSDTEVVIHGYEQWGTDCFDRLNGIFAFALWDAPRRRLVLARDGFGIKPLHYTLDGPGDGRTLRFASEVKSIFQDPAVPREVDHQALHDFLNLRYIPGERTLFGGIRRLRPGHFLVFEDGAVHQERYFRLERPRESRRDEDYYADGIRHHLGEAVRRQMVSDVPLGVYLSGGLDSSAIVACMAEFADRPVKTFSLGFNEPTDELDDARIVADYFATDHHQLSLDPEPLRRFPEVIWHVEEPKENILQGYLLARFARQTVTVAHGGLGGDELFAGYVNNRFLDPSQPFHRLIPRGLARGPAALSRLAFRLQNATGKLALDEYRRGVQLLLSAGDPSRFYGILRNVWDHDEGAHDNFYGPALRHLERDPVRRHFDPFFPDNRNVLDNALWAEIHTKMVDDFLLNEDRTSMAHGLEVRVPFLDRDLVRFALSIPVDLKIRRGETKYIFRRAMQGMLPEHALRKKKWGFSFNPYHQFQKDLRSVAERILTRERVEARGWFHYPYLRRILDHPPHPRLRWHYFFLWLVLGLEIWCRMFLEGDVTNPELELEAYY